MPVLAVSKLREVIPLFIEFYWLYADLIEENLPEMTRDGMRRPQSMAELSPRNAAAIELAVLTIEALEDLDTFGEDHP